MEEGENTLPSKFEIKVVIRKHFELDTQQRSIFLREIDPPVLSKCWLVSDKFTS
jgi:hypothetical protein